MEDETMQQDKAVAAATAKASRRVPKFASAVGRPEMNRLQKSFYQRDFFPSLLTGSPVDVQGHSGYGQVLLYELLDERRTNPIEARNTLVSLVRAYRGADLPFNAKHTLADFYFLEGDFASGYATLGTRIIPQHHLTLSAHLDHPPLTAMQIFRWSEGGVTQKGFKHLDVIFRVLQERLDDCHATHGVSLLEDFWRRVTADKPVSEVTSDIENEVVQRFTGEDVRAILLRAREEPASGDPLGAFQMLTGYEEPIHWPAPWVSWSFHFAFLVPRFRALTREAENTARDMAEIPRVGEGWVSEMTLLREVQAAFPEERVVHQARPGWLSPQSLDIYLPDYNVGIEYQGAQHTRPVEYFGGAEAFERQQYRDAMKRSICIENSCALIEVHPGYQLAQVLSGVEDAMQKAGTRRPSLS